MIYVHWLLLSVGVLVVLYVSVRVIANAYFTEKLAYMKQVGDQLTH